MSEQRRARVGRPRSSDKLARDGRDPERARLEERHLRRRDDGRAISPPATDLRAFVRHLCDRAGPFGGDGVYFYDAAPAVPEAWFFNPDGSSAEFCGNGMRCLGRVVLDLRGADAAVVRSGSRTYTVRRGATTLRASARSASSTRRSTSTPRTPRRRGGGPQSGGEARLPELDPALAFTAVTIPNPHLVAVIDKYVESDLVAMGERVAARRDVFPAGANLSVLLPLAPAEVFVRTFERGAGLTASCGSGHGRRPRGLLPHRPGSTPSAGCSSATPAAWPPCRCRSARTVAPGSGGQRHVRLPRRGRPIRSDRPGGTRPRRASPTPTRSVPTPPSTSGTPRGCARSASRPRPVRASTIRMGDSAPPPPVTSAGGR